MSHIDDCPYLFLFLFFCLVLNITLHSSKPVYFLIIYPFSRNAIVHLNHYVFFCYQVMSKASWERQFTPNICDLSLKATNENKYFED